MKVVHTFLMLLDIVVFMTFVPKTTSKNLDDCFNFDKSCRSCIEQRNCQWCSKYKNGSGEQHCFSRFEDNLQFCASFENPQNVKVITLNKNLTNVEKNTDYDNIVQLKPQLVKLKLRKGDPINITMTYRQVADYPLDLYYLLDLSASMRDDKDKLESLGATLAQKMRNLTSKFKIGFGSFVDKVLAPFVNVHPDLLENPCANTVCATPFSFKNNLKLTADDKSFTEQVADAIISTNIDAPEGGFDALMQAMVCENEIGWRKNVRKIIILSTDAPFHMAGDGKLAGVVQPNDEICHLNRDQFYDKYDVFDYPSIGQIDKVAQIKGVNIIFAVTGFEDLYKNLARRIKGSAYGKLDASSANVVQLVADVYDNITSNVEILEKSATQNSPISLRFFSDCGSGNEIETSTCSGVNNADTFKFTVEVTLTDCPKEMSNTTVIVGTLQDTLTIEIDLECDCKCNQETPKDNQTSLCTNHGIKKCDICECQDGYYGNKCQCSHNATIYENEKKVDISLCRPKGADSSDPVCSGRGACQCEACSCRGSDIFGKYCQCNRYLCLYSNEECAGHGNCKCNECECDLGWTGDYCECRDEASCIPRDGEICSGNGECKCGECNCYISYEGPYCEDCPSCGAGKCQFFRPCILNNVWEIGQLSTEEKENCQNIEITEIKSLEDSLKDHARLCTFIHATTGCQYNFTYKYDMKDKNYKLHSQNYRICSEGPSVLAVSAGFVGGIVAIGILTLIIWKLVTSLHDKREFEKFERLIKNPDFKENTNPLYKETVTTTQNPAYGRTSYGEKQSMKNTKNF